MQGVMAHIYSIKLIRQKDSLNIYTYITTVHGYINEYKNQAYLLDYTTAIHLQT